MWNGRGLLKHRTKTRRKHRVLFGRHRGAAFPNLRRPLSYRLHGAVPRKSIPKALKLLCLGLYGLNPTSMMLLQDCFRV